MSRRRNRSPKTVISNQNHSTKLNVEKRSARQLGKVKPPGNNMSVLRFLWHGWDSGFHLPPTTNPGNRKNVNTARFIRSIKNAPTIGTTTKACGAGPWRRVSACMLAIAVAVAPSQSRRTRQQLSHWHCQDNGMAEERR